MRRARCGAIGLGDPGAGLAWEGETMAVPARRSAGPAAPGWGDVRRQMMAAAQACSAAVAAWLAAGGDDTAPPAAMAAFAIGVLQDLGDVARQQDVGEAVIEAERARAVAEDRAARARGHLRLLS